jgi:hypothetical protein
VVEILNVKHRDYAAVIVSPLERVAHYDFVLADQKEAF